MYIYIERERNRKRKRKYNNKWIGMMPDMNYYTRMEYNIMDYARCATLSEAKKIKEPNKENTTITITRLQKVDCHDAKKTKRTTLKRKKKKTILNK